MEDRWIIAFDTSCADCRRIAMTVEKVADSKLEVVPLSHPAVASWLNAPEGEHLKPTLIHISDTAVRHYNGLRMVRPLASHLGSRSTLSVVRALGALKRVELDDQQPDGQAIDRKRFLQLTAGAAVAGAIVLGMKTPAIAATEANTAADWVAKNRGQLPRDYDAFIAYPPLYRAAIYQSLSPAERSRLWMAQWRRVDATTPAQQQVVMTALSLAGHVQLFGSGASGPDAPGHAAIQSLKAQAAAAFGADQAEALLTQLGPATWTTSAPVIVSPNLYNCTCSTYDDWCSSGHYCTGFIPARCNTTGGCGAFWSYRCDGTCIAH